MISLFLNWINNDILHVSDDLLFIFCCVASLMILSFIIDFFKFIMYYITGGK